MMTTVIEKMAKKVSQRIVGVFEWENFITDGRVGGA